MVLVDGCNRSCGSSIEKRCTSPWDLRVGTPQSVLLSLLADLGSLLETAWLKWQPLAEHEIIHTTKRS
ncbi:hypothetical protein Poli38472_007380 [Pythium oligandrum]|uniref:Uncharacterized protein n=1 Tax=Pythium oligandrum TaxID=41045 RepID=A0A8K1FDA9_PYTOL|nr:hypothetical protein Poli38472_007380 [Pythium oligandrum]|eukprot:TMW59235.1 hypothetical protein Poli38472_007380 [Pythium oligandrum]